MAIAVGARASRAALRRVALRDRGAQAPRADLEARALRRRHARVGRSATGRASAGAPSHERARSTSSAARIEYLRISVTDRCNFRCLYCMPRGRAAVAAEGGHPLVRGDRRGRAPARAARAAPRCGSPAASRRSARSSRRSCACCARCRRSRTSRSRRTACGCPSWRASSRDAGLDRVNMSADSLRPDRIAAIARRDLGFDPIASAIAARGGGPRADQDQRRRDARHQRRRGRGLRAAHARASVARALHRADAGRRDARAHVGARRAERRGARAHRARSARSRPTPVRRAATARRRTTGSPARAGTRRRDHADDAHVLRQLQPRAAHRRRPAAHLPLRRPRGRPARRRCAPASRSSRSSVQALAEKPQEHALLQMQRRRAARAVAGRRLSSIDAL